MRKKTTEEFIEDAQKVHGQKYDYSMVNYNGSYVKVCIVCPQHGEFWQAPSNHLSGTGCKQCIIESRRSSTEKFVKDAQLIYGNKYDYSAVVYKGNKDKVCVICSKHGPFWVTPNNHLRGSECPGCYGTPKYTLEEYVRKAKKVHGEKYDYSHVNYNGHKGKIEIICPEHGIFLQSAGAHLGGAQCPACSNVQRITHDIFISRATKLHEGKYDYSKVKFKSANEYVDILCPIHGMFSQKVSIHLRGYGCQYCGGSKRLTNEEFVIKANAVHNFKYDYSKVEYVNTSTKVCILCPDHGEFWQVPNNHLLGAGCPKCAGKFNDLEFFIERSKNIHGEKYDYSKAEYVASSEKVCIICPHHGEFWQTPSGHMNGQGCPICNQSHLERDVMRFLKSHKIKFETQKTFNWLFSTRAMRLDFFLPDYGVAIECQGGQHFISVDFYGGDAGLQSTIERDNIKRLQCEKHGVRMLYYSDLGIDYPYAVIEDLATLLKAIKARQYVEKSKWSDPELPLNFD